MLCIRIGKNGKAWTVVVLLLLVLALPACSRGGEEAQGGKGTVTGNAGEEPASPPVTGVGAPDEVISRGVPVGMPEEAQPGPPIPQNDCGRKIVKTANLGITSDDIRGGAAKAQQVAARFGGTIVSSQTYRAENSVYANLVLSVPSDRFEDALLWTS